MNDKKKVKIEWLDEIDSTNDYAKKRRADKENLVVVAKRQTGGRGTKGRSFSSGKGGVYLSMLTFYKEFPAKNAFQIIAVRRQSQLIPPSPPWSKFNAKIVKTY